MKYSKSILPIWERGKLRFTGKKWQSQNSKVDPDLTSTSPHTIPFSGPGAEPSHPVLECRHLRHCLSVKTWSAMAVNSSSLSLWVHLILVQNTFKDHLPLPCSPSFSLLFWAWPSFSNTLYGCSFVLAWTFPVTERSIPSRAVRYSELFLPGWASILSHNTVPWSLHIAPGRISSGGKLRLRQT